MKLNIALAVLYTVFGISSFAYAIEPVVVPEPVSTTLFLVGGAAIGVRTYVKKRRDSKRGGKDIV